MRRLFVYLGRLAAILAGFACGALGASAFLHLLFFGGTAWTSDELAFAAGGMLVSVPVVALFAGYFAMVPAMIAIGVAEVLGLRTWLYFALTGGAAGLIVDGLSRLGAEAPSGDAGAAMAFGAAGIVGGLCYWAVAGRRSGNALDRAVSGRTPSGS